MLDRGSSITSDPLFCQIAGAPANTPHHMTTGVANHANLRDCRNPMPNCANDGALRDILAFFGRP